MGRNPSCGFLEDQSERNAAHYGNYDPVEPPMQPVQAPQLLQYVFVSGFGAVCQSDERIMWGQRSHEDLRS